ncbi:MAG TPA: hypothetical protein PKW30_07310, partial [Campylobacterales bacterium]|nr:hypothetical protein [Campylobacterales bacterium]
MLNDLKDSIKAKLYDFNYTPFMSSLLISWIVINHKYLLVLFSDKIDVDKKLMMLNDAYSYNAVFGYFSFYLAPLLFALFYVYIYPLISKKFYEYTLEQTKALKKIKQEIEDKTPLTQEEAREIRTQIDKLSTERDEAIQKAVEAENRYRQKYEAQMDAMRMKELIEPPVGQSAVANKIEEDDEAKILRYLYESNYTKDYKGNAISKIVSATKIPLIV